MEPIVAISSPPSASLRGILRISGDGLIKLLGPLLDSQPEPRRLTVASLVLDGHRLPVLALWMPGPATFTSQDTLEIQLPGGRPLLAKAQDHVLAVLRQTMGAGRLAESGEFTRRALEAGRLNLLEVESIAATISAVGDAELSAAASLRTGALGQWAEQLVGRLGDLLAQVEAGIDFMDQDDVVAIAPNVLQEGLDRLLEEMHQLLESADRHRLKIHPPTVVLAGPSNAGKSTLFNALLGHRRSVISQGLATTRDPLFESMHVDSEQGPREMVLVDTAGLWEGATGLDASAIESTRRAVQEADCVVWVQPVGDEDAMAPPAAGSMIQVWSKIDVQPAPHDGRLGVCALDGRGLEALKAKLVEQLSDQLACLSDHQMVLQDRHAHALSGAAEAVAEAMATFDPKGKDLAEPECVADLLRLALDRLGEMGGVMGSDDVIGRVFATFCVGK